jgi:DNA repair photolyase
MIISASRRTDIPAFFSDWFYNRIEKGFFAVRNPMNIHQVSIIPVRPDVTDCIVFWTKNPRRFMDRLHLLSSYSYYFQYTLTGYGKILEPNIPRTEDSIECFKSLSNLIGSNRVIWRYDPILITDQFDIRFHMSNFEKIAQQLSRHTNKCVISFVDYYKKTIKNLSGISYRMLNRDQITEIASKLSQIAMSNNITLSTCAEEIDLLSLGICHGKCIDDKLINEVFGFTLNINKDKFQRKECGCVASIDIGAYNTCPHGCLYCYANYDLNKVKSNYVLHNKNADLIFGNISHLDKVSLRKVFSCKILQKDLFSR